MRATRDATRRLRRSRLGVLSPATALAVAACAAVIGCSASVARPPVMYATGQVTDIAELRVETTLGTLNGVRAGSVLLVFEVSDEEVDPGSGDLVRVRLSPVGVVGVHDAAMGGCVGRAGAGSEAMLVGHYARMIDPASIPETPWWEDAHSWWRSIHNRNAIIGTDRTLPFYHGKSKRNRAE